LDFWRTGKSLVSARNRTKIPRLSVLQCGGNYTYRSVPYPTDACNIKRVVSPELNISKTEEVRGVENTAEPGYNDIGLSETSSITSDIR
jgi:hypothetical protein